MSTTLLKASRTEKKQSVCSLLFRVLISVQFSLLIVDEIKVFASDYVLANSWLSQKNFSHTFDSAFKFRYLNLLWLYDDFSYIIEKLY